MLVRLFGSGIFSRAGVLRKAPYPILVTPSFTVMDLRLLHPSKIASPQSFIMPGMKMSSNFSHPLKAEVPMPVTP
ncbi:hypothetical protein Barb6_03245 [Bacteroidales bacterium Barb6]|nr:hypothetical protein Barb6_03245 [Bacteroidales bacterium Barb6]